jgi:hypothetical protein
MTDAKEPNASDLDGAIADQIREASRAGRLVRLESVWQRSEEEFAAWRESQAAAAMADIAMIQERDEVFLSSELSMSRAFAAAAARAGCRDICWAIAQTVRNDSQTYPRPTPLSAFGESPFFFSKDLLDRAMQDILDDPQYADIRSIRSSDGSIFLFSSAHLDPARAESLAEWLAVGHVRNP